MLKKLKRFMKARLDLFGSTHIRSQSAHLVRSGPACGMLQQYRLDLLGQIQL